MLQTRGALDVIEVKRPCPISWESMQGEERSRACEYCGLQVHNLSAISSDEAQRLVCERAGRLCVRFERDSAGRVLTLDYQPFRCSGRTWRFWTLFGCVSALVAAVARAALWSPPPRNTVIVGMIAPSSIQVPPAPGQR